jgi:hypothetical protein
MIYLASTLREKSLKTVSLSNDIKKNLEKQDKTMKIETESLSHAINQQSNVAEE